MIGTNIEIKMYKNKYYTQDCAFESFSLSLVQILCV